MNNLLSKEIVPKRTHSISYLLNDCIKQDERFNVFIDTILLEVEDCAVQLRYDDIEEIDREFIEQVLKELYKLKDFVEDIIK